MNDATLRQLLRQADKELSPEAPLSRTHLAAGVVERDRRRRLTVRRRRVATSAAVLLLAIGVAVSSMAERKGTFTGATPALSANVLRPDAVEVNTARVAPADDALDDQLAAAERRVAALEQGERLARVAGDRTAVRDPLADAAERRATAVLNDADRLRASPADADRRRRLLALLVRLYPNTISAVVARQEVGGTEPEKRT